jgi:SNF2 family DNA or RNA helicase
MNNLHAMLVQGQGTSLTPRGSTEKAKTLIMPSHSAREAQTPSQTLNSNPQVQTVPFPETQTTQSKRTNPNMVDDYSWPGVYPPMVHQKDTANFLVHHKRAFCFNEQGTGKTASAIWAADFLLENTALKRVLIVCPLSIMQSAWQADLFKFAVHRKVGLAYGDRNKRKAIINSDAEFVIINYDGVEIVADDISKGKFGLIIIDEANAYKTVTTNRWKVMNKLVTPNTGLWLMTGTPAAQSPTDAYGLAKLCVPDRVPRFFGAFRDKTMTNISKFRWIPKPNANEIVFDALQPAIRYVKKDCLDLPEITHVFRDAPLTSQQEKYYKLLKKEMLMVAGGEEISAVNAAVNLNKLLQISGGAVYSDNGSVVEFDVSNRLKVIEEVINESSNKILVFVPFTHTIELLRSHLRKAGISCEVINGSVPVNRRTEIFKNFQTQPEPKVLIIQPQAASHGVTLTAADTVVWYAPVTSIETYLQANARIDRQGQKNKMTVVHIKGSPVETRMYGMLQNKLDVHTRIIDLYKKEVEENT